MGLIPPPIGDGELKDIELAHLQNVGKLRLTGKLPNEGSHLSLTVEHQSTSFGVPSLLNRCNIRFFARNDPRFRPVINPLSVKTRESAR